MGLQLGVVNGYNRGNSNNLRALSLGYNPYDYNGMRYTTHLSLEPTAPDISGLNPNVCLGKINRSFFQALNCLDPA